ncbi:B-cell receptor CD22-like isoform X1 [Gymnodraco acuticeps]|uniref:B-cell receptor CD22-like isoform X1 n=1 Tax=Gymnodraco acuticeps TaxID=8218 RepID=A0A6P8W550_GYMAC|nr:B-cell receptor CD22-like isoform X1 [Gymnodraco acuticeps]
MSLPVRGFVVFLLSAQVVQGQDDWGVTYSSTEICAVKGSTVEMRCTYTYPFKVWFTIVEKTFWFTKQKDGEPVDLTTDSEYAGRVEDRCENNICTLRIRNLRESDSAEYKFRIIIQKGGSYIGSPGVTLSVTDLQLKVSRAYSGQAELKCQTSCHVPDNTSYIWYKNGEELWTGISYSGLVNFGSADIYSCALNGQENHRSPSVYAPKPPSVSVSPSAEIEEGSSVTLTCSSDANPAANYTWYKDETSYSSILNEEHQIVFSSTQASDSGEYFCTAENMMGRKTSENVFIDVKYAPKPPSVSVSPSAEIEEGSSVTLTCSSDANPAANYTWYKDETSYSSILNEEPQLVFSSMQASDSGEYFCTAENKLGRRTSEKLFIDVKYKSPMIMNITRLVLVVLVLVPPLLVCLWMRKKKAVSYTTEANEPIETVELDPFSVYENVSDLNMVSAEQTEEPEEQEDLV